jgi:glycosyltransferase involved in cell wall biosynthesis
MERLTVLFVSRWFPTREQPVGGVFVRELAKAVALHDDVVVLHCSGLDPSLSKLWRLQQETDGSLTNGIATYRVSHRSFMFKKISYFVYIWSIFQAFRKIASEGIRPHIIHAHSYDAGLPAILIGKIYRIPAVVTEHSSEFPRKQLGRLGPNVARFAFEKAKLVMTVSRSLKKAIEGYGIKANFRVIPNVVDTKLFKPGTSVRQKDGLKRLLCVALFNPSHIKGIPYLLEAFSLLKKNRNDWQLDIVGDGPARADYESLKAELELGDKIIFHGAKTRQEVAEFVRQADLFVLPSLFETFSLATAEALAAGTPVLATRCGGPEEFITEDVGMLVPPGNASALCKGLDYMLDHLETFSSEHISSYARNRFSPQTVGDKVHRLYIDCLTRNKS